MPTATLPPGPHYRLPGALLWHLSRGPLAYFTDLKRRHGDVVRVTNGGVELFVLSDPELIREVLVTRERSFRKGRGLQVARRMVGNGLLTSEGDFHRCQRKLMQPVFQRQRVESFTAKIRTATLGTLSEWRTGETVDVLSEMHILALRIVGRTLFDSELEHHAQGVSEALEDGRRVLRLAMFPLLEKLESLIPALRRRAEDSRARLDAILLPLIEEHRRNPHDDLLSMLIEADMSDQQVRDEAVTLFLAGHETTANGLAWALHLLAQHPEWQDPARAEAVLLEAMRLYPPAWMVGRQALEPVELGPYVVPAGATVICSQYLTHRDLRWFPDPERFDPGRWERCPRASLPRYAYFPFGGGSRVCIGEHFAMLEGRLILESILTEFRLEAVPGQTIEPRPRITLRPHPGPQVRLVRR